MRKTTKWPRNDPLYRKVATGFWFAVQRMIRRGGAPPDPSGWQLPPDPDDDGLSGAGVRRHPPDSPGSVGAALTEPEQPSDIE